jgi:hypothetical protein
MPCVLLLPPPSGPIVVITRNNHSPTTAFEEVLATLRTIGRTLGGT